MAGGAVADVGYASTGPVARPASVRQSLPAILVAAASAFGGVLYGYDTGTISGLLAMDNFKQTFGRFYENVPSNTSATAKPGFDLSTNDTSLVVSILSAGTFAGALAGAPISDICGRRWGMQVALVVFCAGVIMQMATTDLNVFIGGRVVAGIGVGILSTIVPMYQSETAPRWIRGAVVSGYQWAITIGLLCASLATNGTKNRDNTSAWRIPIGIQFAFALVLCAFFLILPESPRWLVKRGNSEGACKSLARLNSTDVDDPLVRSELSVIQTNLDIELTHSTGSYLDCFKFNDRKYSLRAFTGIFIQAFQQLTGINFIFYFGTRFFQSALPNSDPFIFSVISNVVNVVTTLPGMYMMERVGRRNLLIWGAVWMCVCELIVAVVGTTVPTSNTAGGKTLVAFVCIYIAGFAATWGPAAWVVCGEIFPLAIRAKALSLCTASNWLWNFGIGYATPYLVDSGAGHAGLGTKVFFIWTGTCAGCVVFAYLFVYETRLLSLEEVDELYSQCTASTSIRANNEMRARRSDLEGAVAPPKDDELATHDEKKY
ncbi:probable monosaccharide transporter [Melanopsichium pennsylvanicum]|uniref:Probable monosaccharide transporter n=2 Tax=Melanopsichium pennsylvanicum TaxID=63383 RepID=A0AAJ4XQ12_9BASI|nr:probable monosaccharide transporter [Melanopsichium pennsylvanicum 4]SNX86410.1 probable monosaccharide transporter [Melanopsichium pennsylvanicum]